MTVFHGKVRSLTKWVMLLAVLPAAVAWAEDNLSPSSGQTRVVLSADLGRLAPQATPQVESPQPGSVDVGDLRLSLREAVLLALKNNLDIAIANYNPKITAESITIAKAVFDPLVSLTVDANKTVKPSTSVLGGAVVSSTENQDVNASLSQTLPIGGSYTLGLTNNRLNTNSSFARINPAYQTTLTLSITQNLLKNFGPDVNTAPIKIARNNQAISVTQLRQQANQVITSVNSAYWSLVFAIENLEVQKRSLRLARELEELNKARVRAGVAAPVEVTQAEAQAAAQVQNVILAEKAIKDAEDQLKLIVNIPDGERIWTRTIVPADAAPFETAPVNAEASIQEALEKRPEYAAAKLTLQNSDLDLRVKRNQLLPSLQFQGSVGLNEVALDALRLIGFAVYDRDPGALELRDGDCSLLPEIESGEHPIDLAPHYRLRQRIEREIERRGVAPRGLLIVNGARLMPPEQRAPEVSEALRVAAETMRYCIAPTHTLFGAV
ncbi:MAG: TolC family protein, partial [candidate division NC10 bacterium]|nr:TolC family protein [candidate division NC10 bacterium]